MDIHSKEFAKLKKLWDKKLEASGFDDIECKPKKSTTESYLRGYSGSFEDMDSKQDYYRIAGFFLNDYKFVDSYDKFVWECHSEGKSIRKIVMLFKQKGIHTYKDKVDLTLQKLKKEMLKKYKVK